MLTMSWVSSAYTDVARSRNGSGASEAKRKAKWQPREHDYQSGAIWKYAQTVGPACKGAVTHPGAQAETHVYADI